MFRGQPLENFNVSLLLGTSPGPHQLRYYTSHHNIARYTTCATAHPTTPQVMHRHARDTSHNGTTQPTHQAGRLGLHRPCLGLAATPQMRSALSSHLCLLCGYAGDGCGSQALPHPRPAAGLDLPHPAGAAACACVCNVD
jgi:hypothetical protein